jgi:UPF0148 protein
MAELMRQGATLTGLACPACSAPLLKLKNGDFWCARCEKKVIVVKEGEEQTSIAHSIAFDSLEAMLLTKVQEIQEKMRQEKNMDELQKLAYALSGLLDNLEKTRKAKKT